MLPSPAPLYDGAAHRTGDINAEAAVDPNTGAIYVVWQDSSFGPRSSIALSRSTDGGLTWSAPIKVNATPTSIPLGNQQAFTPMVSVRNDSTVAVSYYDFRNNTAVGGALTDAFVAHCHASCTSIANWSETRVTATSFDIEDAPVARGYFLGDYMGLTNVGTSFGALYVTSGSGTTSPPTDVYWSKVGP